MAKINVLPKSVAELIAAGEVVERPSSVVKELIENSIDAAAKSITVEIKNGGIRYIRVTDDGCGISAEDIPTAFISHATSKISSGDDLDAIMTLGFRGEALPSIAAVSRLSLLAKPADAGSGHLFEIAGGEAGDLEEAGCPDGTTITVRDLFYNTPARMKFLKKDSTEGVYVCDVVTKTAIAHTNVKFCFIREGKQIFSTPGNGDLYETVYSVLGKDIADCLIKCDYEYNSIKVSGFISKPLNNRPNRNYQYFYVNNRYVKIPAAAVALDEGYKNSIMVGKFPMCFLNITIPAGKIDVNVHPAKTEVRFSDEKTIFEAVYYSAKSALAMGDNARPTVNVPKKKPLQVQQNTVNPGVQYRFDFSQPVQQKKTESAQTVQAPVKHDPVQQTKHEGAVFRDTSSFFAKPPVVHNPSIDIVCDDEDDVKKKEQSPAPEHAADEKFSTFSDMLSAFGSNSKANFSAETPTAEAFPQGKPTEEKKTATEIMPAEMPSVGIVTDDTKRDTAKIIGEIFNTYILVERDSKLLIIDKHAAHERMIFNSLAKEDNTRGSQILMMPVTVSLSSKEYAAVLENTELFSKAGYCVEDFGENCVAVREVPTELADGDIKDIVTEMAGKLVSGNLKPVPEKLDWLYDSTACRAAIKAGSTMKREEMEVFVKKLLADESIKYCPHGRPVMFELTKHEIEKQFGRLG